MSRKQSYEWLAKDFTEGNEGIAIETSKGPFLVKFSPCGKHYQLESTGPLSLDKVLGCANCRSSTEYGLSKKGIDISSLSQKGNFDSPDFYFFRYSDGELGRVYDNQSIVRPDVKTSLPDYVKGLK